MDASQIPYGRPLTIEEQMVLRENAAVQISDANRETMRYVRTFRHRHVNNGKDDSCKQCGLDLRDLMHLGEF